MKPVSEQCQEIKKELDLNQQEYKDRQDILLKKLAQLQKHCFHDNAKFDDNLQVIKCPDCLKVVE